MCVCLCARRSLALARSARAAHLSTTRCMRTMALRGSRRAISFSMATWEHAEQVTDSSTSPSASRRSLLPAAAPDRANGRLTRNFDARYLLQYGSLAGFALLEGGGRLYLHRNGPCGPSLLVCHMGNPGGLAS